MKPAGIAFLVGGLRGAIAFGAIMLVAGAILYFGDTTLRILELLRSITTVETTPGLRKHPTADPGRPNDLTGRPDATLGPSTPGRAAQSQTVTGP